MKLEDIGFYTLSDQRARTANVSSPLQRCELILSDECNFDCPYCMKIREDYSKELSYDEATRIVGMWCDGNLQNIRFSGGEPSMWQGLPELVTYAKHRGVKRIAVSTNGSASAEYYLGLIQAGVDDFSISLDACCASTGDLMAGRRGIYQRITDNIKLLSSKVYVTVGVVLTELNIAELRRIVYLASSELGVSDIRIITAAQWNSPISESALDRAVLDKHPILRYRMHNYATGRNVRGLSDGVGDSHQCPMVLDDMAVVGDYHFPCIIYMRQRGDPIGRMEGSIRDVRRARQGWYLKTDTHKDPICKRICLDVCVDYNNKYRDFQIFGWAK